MAGECKLRAANGLEWVACEGERCIFWRAVEHLGVEPLSPEGCAIQYFDLLEGTDPELARWLLSLKERVERLMHPDTER